MITRLSRDKKQLNFRVFFRGYVSADVGNHVDNKKENKIRFRSASIALERSLQQLETWTKTLGMRFNAKKCYLMSINQKSAHFYQLDGHILQQVPDNPYLGVTLSDDMKWNSHINKISKKANSTLGFLKRNLKHCQ